MNKMKTSTEKLTKREIKYCSMALSGFNGFAKDKISTIKDNYDRINFLYNWIYKINLEKIFQEYRNKFLKALKIFNSTHVKRLTPIQFGDFCVKALKTYTLTDEHLYDENTLKDIHNLIAYGKTPLISEQYKLLNARDSLYLKYKFSIPSLEFAKYFNKFLDFNTSLYAIKSTLEDDLPFFTDQNQMEYILNIKRKTSNKRKTTRKVRK